MYHKTLPFAHTTKSREILNKYDNAQTLGKFRVCFITGKETTEYHTYKINNTNITCKNHNKFEKYNKNIKIDVYK